MKRIILFRFHKNAAVCRNRLRILKYFNPNIEIFGLYGGKKEDLPRMRRMLGDLLKNIYRVPVASWEWKWKNGDMNIRYWYKAYGHRLDFDTVYLAEWDELVFGKIGSLYWRVPKNGIGATGLTPLDWEHWEDKWYWTGRQPYKNEWLRLKKMAGERYGHGVKPYGCIFGGICLPKKFLERYAREKIPVLSNDEARVMLYARIFGFRLYNTGFLSNFSDKEGMRFFNADNRPVALSDIKKELERSKGKRVFHPYKRIFDLKELAKVT